MLFIEWWLVQRFTLLIALLVASCTGWWLVRNKRKSIRVAVVIMSSPIAVLAGLFLALQFLALGCLSYSSPVYSPDHSQAVRVRTDDEGATGGNSHVDLFWNHGFSSKEVYWGGWKSVHVKDLKWESNSTLELWHDSPIYLCESSRRVQVKCFGTPTRNCPADCSISVFLKQYELLKRSLRTPCPSRPTKGKF